MAEYSTPEERTEMPTAKRMEKLREEGAVHSSNEVAVVASLIAGFIALQLVWSWIWQDMKLIFIKSFRAVSATEPLEIPQVYGGFLWLLRMVGPEVFFIVFIVSLVASLSVMLQTKWNIKKKKLDIKFSKLNPIGGITRIFSINGVVSTLKAILKLIIILPIGYFGLKGLIPNMVSLIHTTVSAVLVFTSHAIVSLFWKFAYIFIAIAVFDYFWTKHQWLKQNKMTKQEVKDEKKSIEGDEETRRKIAAKGLERIAQRIFTSVPQADVVITNPTHYAVALKYDKDEMPAPEIVAKGAGFVALRIKEIAKDANVPIVERKPLARALYHSGEVGKTIPYELYKAVAEVIAYVYRLKNPWAYRDYDQQGQGGRDTVQQ
ncbi:MAG: flagellar biosynthesis protein FlhB [Candidatus Dadabacteria bacterium]|nr:MAG: flagellar biosynthesis protein FlhB [Candidatus Dadabacteria bacterium]